MAIIRKLFRAIKKTLVSRKSRRPASKISRKKSPHKKIRAAASGATAVAPEAVPRRPAFLRDKRRGGDPKGRPLTRKASRKPLKSKRGRVSARKIAPRKAKKKFLKPSAVKRKKEPKVPPLGVVTHYFSKIGVCVVKIKGNRISVGDKIHVKGHTSNFVQEIRSLQIEHRDVSSGVKGDLVGLKVNERTRIGDRVFKAQEK